MAQVAVPQSEPLSANQVLNHEGGFVFQVHDLTLLRRYIVLGSAANNYYVSRHSVDLASAQCVVRLLAAGQGEAVVKEVVDISREGRAPKQATGIVVLAMCARLGDPATSRAALLAVPAVCRTASTLFEWVQRCKELGAAAGIAKTESGAVNPAAFATWAADGIAAAEAAAKAAAEARADRRHRRGRRRRRDDAERAPDADALTVAAGSKGKLSWGRAMRRTVARWYLAKTPAAVAFQATKYSQRNGWSHADLLRLAHPDPEQHTAKRQKLAEGSAAAVEAAPAAAAPAAAEAAGNVDSDSEWVFVGASENGEGSELDTLAAAMAAAAPAAAAADDVAAAAKDQWVVDMKAVFDYLTHGTVPESAQLSPVMQYLVDAHRLRKEIRLPPPPQPVPDYYYHKVGEQTGQRGRAAVKAAGKAAAAAAAERSKKAGKKSNRVKVKTAAEVEHEAATFYVTETALSLIRRHRFGHERVGDTELLRNPAVWGAFLENGMPLTAMIRNLGRMSELGLLAQPNYQQRVTDRLRDARALTAARVHPMTLLDAMCTYRNGSGARGKTWWSQMPAVSSALEDAFYLAFKNVVPTGKRYLLGLDVSGSMGCRCSGMTSVTARQAAAAVVMSLVRTEPWVKTMAFSHKLVEFNVRESDRLEEVVERAARIPMGGTDCALPMIYATEKKLPVDVFVVLTDNETWFGGVHPTEALKRYRAAMKLPDAKLVVLAFSVNEFSIADPKDPGMLDVAGLDSAVPRVVADFVRGGL